MYQSLHTCICILKLCQSKTLGKHDWITKSKTITNSCCSPIDFRHQLVSIIDSLPFPVTHDSGSEKITLLKCKCVRMRVISIQMRHINTYKLCSQCSYIVLTVYYIYLMSRVCHYTRVCNSLGSYIRIRCHTTNSSSNFK